MQDFEQIFQRAATRKGGEDQLKSLLPPIKSVEEVCLLTDDRILSIMTQCIFQAGFNWKVVEKKWPEFETVFNKLKPEILELLSAEDLEALAKDARIIRNMQKIITVPRNAQWINEIAKEHGSFAKFIGLWPTYNIVELFKLLKAKGRASRRKYRAKSIKTGWYRQLYIKHRCITGIAPGGYWPVWLSRINERSAADSIRL